MVDLLIQPKMPEVGSYTDSYQWFPWVQDLEPSQYMILISQFGLPLVEVSPSPKPQNHWEINIGTSRITIHQLHYDGWYLLYGIEILGLILYSG